jgi:hypothetical protein
MVVGALAVVLAWGYSAVEPDSFGVQRYWLRFGPKPTVRDCHAYGPADFLVPLAAIFTLERAGIELRDGQAELARRGEEFLQTLPESGGAQGPDRD